MCHLMLWTSLSCPLWWLGWNVPHWIQHLLPTFIFFIYPLAQVNHLRGIFDSSICFNLRYDTQSRLLVFAFRISPAYTSSPPFPKLYFRCSVFLLQTIREAWQCSALTDQMVPFHENIWLHPLYYPETEVISNIIYLNMCKGKMESKKFIIV